MKKSHFPKNKNSFLLRQNDKKNTRLSFQGQKFLWVVQPLDQSLLFEQRMYLQKF